MTGLPWVKRTLLGLVRKDKAANGIHRPCVACDVSKLLKFKELLSKQEAVQLAYIVTKYWGDSSGREPRRMGKATDSGGSTGWPATMRWPDESYALRGCESQ